MKNDRQLTLVESAIILLLAFILGMFMSKDANAQDIKSLIVTEANRQGFDADLALAIAEVESRLNPNARGTHGEVGVFQLHPGYHAVSTDVRSNVRTAIRYLKELQVTCASYGEAFFVCFNYGTARRLKHPKLFPYFKKVQVVIRKHRQTYVASSEE
jgi:hypothetical protein